MDRSVIRQIALAALLLFVLTFAALSVDVMARVWSWRARFTSPFDVAFLFYLEGVRSIVILAGIAIAASAGRRAALTTSAAALAFGVGFATLAYAKLTAFARFPGDVQERTAVWLGERGLTPDILSIFFAQPEWAAWLALAAFLMFAANYPRPLTPDDIALSGVHDRRGAMRSVALAGIDIGALARAATAFALSRGWLRGRVVWTAAAIIGIAHTALLRALPADIAVNLLLLGSACVPVAVLLALLRAGASVAADTRRAPLLWLRRGALYGLALFAGGALITQLLPALPLGAITLSVAPAAIAACWLIAVLEIRS